jgi:hypothetical protein
MTAPPHQLHDRHGGMTCDSASEVATVRADQLTAAVAAAGYTGTIRGGRPSAAAKICSSG